MLALRRSVFAVRSAAAIQVAPRRGLEEFFDNYNSPYQKVHHGTQKQIAIGRAWEASELRRKSDEDLHKLWYVCLKERNMLLTLKHDADVNGRNMDGQDRIKQVKLTMNRIKVVIGEREKAVEVYQREERKRQYEERNAVANDTGATGMAEQAA